MLRDVDYEPKDVMIELLRLIQKVLQKHFDVVSLNGVVSRYGLRIEDLRYESPMLAEAVAIAHRCKLNPFNSALNPP